MTLDFEWFLCHAKQHSNVHPFLLSPRISYTPCLFFLPSLYIGFLVKFTCMLDVYYYIKHKWPAIFYFNIKFFIEQKALQVIFVWKILRCSVLFFFILILCFCIDQYPLIEQHGFLLLVILLLLFSSLHNMHLYTILHVMCHCSTLRIV